MDQSRVPVRAQHYSSGNMQALQKEWGSRNVVWLTINSTNASHSEVQDAARDERLDEGQGARLGHAARFDQRHRRAYSAKTTPHMFVVDPAARSSTPGRSTTSGRESGRREDRQQLRPARR
jgi:hypothetical protein